MKLCCSLQGKFHFEKPPTEKSLTERSHVERTWQTDEAESLLRQYCDTKYFQVP